VLAAKGKPLDKMFGRAITTLQPETLRKRHCHLAASKRGLSSPGKDKSWIEVFRSCEGMDFLAGSVFDVRPCSILGRVIPHNEAAPAGANLNCGICAGRGATGFSTTVLARRQHRTNATNKKRKLMLVKLSTDKTVGEAAAALQAAVEANHFGVMQVHNLKETMTKKGVEFAHECLIFEVCQPQQAKKVLDQNMSVSTAVPCRISIYEEGGKTILATLKPTTLLAL
jgi:uncharacterized protein (DUF302 family)